MAKKALPCRREEHAPWPALKESDTELLLQGLDLPAQRRLGDVETLGGAHDRAFFRDRDKALDLIDGHAPTLPRGNRGGKC